MTLQQAIEEWGLSERKLLTMLSEGIIPGIKTENNVIILPDIPKPLIIPTNAKKSAENIYKYILSAVSAGCYLDANLFGDKFHLSDSDFKDYINELERCGLLKRKSSYIDSHSSLGFIIAADRQKDVNKIIKSKNLLSAIKKLVPNININICCVVA